MNSGGKEVFHKKPLGRRRHLMSKPTRVREFSTVTSGTERKRGFAGILPCHSEPLMLKLSIDSEEKAVIS